MDEFNEFRTRILAVFDCVDILGSRYEYSGCKGKLWEAVEEAYCDAFRSVHNKVRELFESEGIQNIDLPGFEKIWNFEDDPMEVFKRIDLRAHWESLIAKKDAYAKEGVRKFAETLSRKLFGWGFKFPHDVKQQKTCLVVSVPAYESSYSFHGGYEYGTAEEIMVILEAIQHVAFSNNLDDIFSPHSCRLAMSEHFSSGNRVEYCDHCEIATRKRCVKFRLSYKLMEAIQIFLADHGFTAD